MKTVAIAVWAGLLGGCAVPERTLSRTIAEPAAPHSCTADACVYGEPFSNTDLGVWAAEWHLEDARAPSLILLARAHDCRARGVEVSDAELVDYIRSGGALGEFGEPRDFDLQRYARVVKIKYGLAVTRYEELRRREAVVARCKTPALWPGWPRQPPPTLPKLDDEIERLRALGAISFGSIPRASTGPNSAGKRRCGEGQDSRPLLSCRYRPTK